MTNRVVRLLLGSLLAGGVCSLLALSWHIEPVTTDPEDDWGAWIAVDQNNALHVAYSHHDPDNEVFYATNASGSWQSSRVTDNGLSDIAYDIVVARDGTVHIAYQGNDGTDEEVYHAFGSPAHWTIERVTDNTKNEGYPSMAQDRDGYLHIAYFGYDPSGTDYEVFYATNKPGHWVVEQVTYNGDDDVMPALALDTGGNPAIAYMHNVGANYTARYAHKVAGIWADVLVSSPPVTYVALVTDRSDFAHVAYQKFDGADIEVCYANNVTGTWQESPVTANSTSDNNPSLELDNQGHAFIVYQANDGDAEVFYATNEAGVWQTSRITDNAGADAYQGRRGFVTDHDGYAHAVFHTLVPPGADVFHARSDVPIHAGLQESPAPRRAALRLTTGPEPCAGAVHVRYDVPAAGAVSLAVFDATGRHVTALASGTQSAGTHQVVWNTASITPGVYFCRLTTEGDAATRRVTVLH